MAKKKQATYRVTNWREYNESLVRRGDITLWFEEDVLSAWEHTNSDVKVGRPFIYSDTAIECLLSLRELFRLPYRQTEGLGRALMKLMEVEVAIPSFTLLAKRAAKLKVALNVADSSGPLQMVVDSTGLKIVGGALLTVTRSGGRGVSSTCRLIRPPRRLWPSCLQVRVGTMRLKFPSCLIKWLDPSRNFTPTGLTTSGACTTYSSGRRLSRSFPRGVMLRLSSTATAPLAGCLAMKRCGGCCA